MAFAGSQMCARERFVRAFVFIRETTSVNVRPDGRFAFSGRQMCTSVMFAGACRAARVDTVKTHQRNVSHGNIYAVRSRPGQPHVTHTMTFAPRACEPSLLKGKASLHSSGASPRLLNTWTRAASMAAGLICRWTNIPAFSKCKAALQSCAGMLARMGRVSIHCEV